jgi:hypothetical protein
MNKINQKDDSKKQNKIIFSNPEEEEIINYIQKKKMIESFSTEDNQDNHIQISTENDIDSLEGEANNYVFKSGEVFLKEYLKTNIRNIQSKISPVDLMSDKDSTASIKQTEGQSSEYGVGKPKRVIIRGNIVHD